MDNKSIGLSIQSLRMQLDNIKDKIEIPSDDLMQTLKDYRLGAARHNIDNALYYLELSAKHLRLIEDE